MKPIYEIFENGNLLDVIECSEDIAKFIDEYCKKHGFEIISSCSDGITGYYILVNLEKQTTAMLTRKLYLGECDSDGVKIYYGDEVADENGRSGTILQQTNFRKDENGKPVPYNVYYFWDYPNGNTLAGDIVTIDVNGFKNLKKLKDVFEIFLKK